MDRRRNPYAPGAGTPPPELAGRDVHIDDFGVLCERLRAQRPEQSPVLVGLRGVGKTVLLNRFEDLALGAGFAVTYEEITESEGFADLIIKIVTKLLRDASRRKRLGDAARRVITALTTFTATYEGVTVGIDPDDLLAADALDLTELFLLLGAALAEHDQAAVILLDEIQNVRPDDFRALVVALHRVNQKRYPIGVVAAGLPQVLMLLAQARTYSERVFLVRELGPLDHADTVNAITVPAHMEHVKFQGAAVETLAAASGGYPYFIQSYGKAAWNTARRSPITDADAQAAIHNADAELDRSFFRIRMARVTAGEETYLRAIADLMAELGPAPVKTSSIAAALGHTAKDLSPVRDRLIAKGIIFSPRRSLLDFTVPHFDRYLRRR